MAAHLRAHLASRWLPMAWLFRKPDWVEHDAQARLPFQRFRGLGLLWNLGVMPLFAAALIIAASADQQARHATLHGTTTPSVPSAR